MSIGRLRVLIAPDSFKGSLSSVDVARALAEGWARARPEDELVLAPLADGGEGTLGAIAESGGWEWRECVAHDPLGRPLTARWLLSVDGTRAVVELAEASGLSRLPRDEPRNPVAATTEGTGEILRAVLDAGVRHVMIGVGGSATTDGGAGLLRGLGARFGGSSGTAAGAGAARTARAGRPTGAGGGRPTGAGGGSVPGGLGDVASVDLFGLDPRLAQIELRVACDVTNPLLGPQGAAAVYGPQKGAWPEDVAALEAWLTRYADLLETASGVRARDRAGAGAAGGTGFALMCLTPRLCSFDLIPGVELVMQETRFDEHLAHADLVITGEGQVDAQTAFGKTALGVARRAAAAGVPCLAVGGSVTPEGAAVMVAEGAVAMPVLDRPMTLGEAMNDVSSLVIAAGERLARIVAIGGAAAVRSSRS